MNFYLLSHDDFLEKFNQNVCQVASIRKFLLDLGIPPNKVGYKFLIDAVKYVLDHDCANLSLTKDIYIHISRRHQTSVSNVDRAIRYVIEYIWKYYDAAHIKIAYGHSSKIGRPTNSEFIYQTAEKIRGICTYPFLSKQMQVL